MFDRGGSEVECVGLQKHSHRTSGTRGRLEHWIEDNGPANAAGRVCATVPAACDMYLIFGRGPHGLNGRNMLEVELVAVMVAGQDSARGWL